MVPQALCHGPSVPVGAEKLLEYSSRFLLEVAFGVLQRNIGHKREGLFHARVHGDWGFLKSSGTEPFRVLDEHELESGDREHLFPISRVDPFLDLVVLLQAADYFLHINKLNNFPNSELRPFQMDELLDYCSSSLFEVIPTLNLLLGDLAGNHICIFLEFLDLGCRIGLHIIPIE